MIQDSLWCLVLGQAAEVPSRDSKDGIQKMGVLPGFYWNNKVEMAIFITQVKLEIWSVFQLVIGVRNNRNATDVTYPM